MTKSRITVSIVMFFLALVLIVVLANSCARVEPNYEGVLMSNYGRNGKQDFKSVTGRQNTILPGTTLYQVPMFEQKGDPTSVVITARDAGVFSVDPTYTYQPANTYYLKPINNISSRQISIAYLRPKFIQCQKETRRLQSQSPVLPMQ